MKAAIIHLQFLILGLQYCHIKSKKNVYVKFSKSQLIPHILHICNQCSLNLFVRTLELLKWKPFILLNFHSGTKVELAPS